METKTEKEQIESLTNARRIYSVSLTKYAGDKDSSGYGERRREWNKAKELVAREVKAATPEGTGLKAFAKVKANGSHKAGHSFQPKVESILFESMEQERLDYTDRARAILHSGTRAAGILYWVGNDKTLDSYVLRCAKQDGLVREPLPSHPVQPIGNILSMSDSLEWKADRKAAERWLEWRNRSIEYYKDAASQEVMEQMEQAMRDNDLAIEEKRRDRETVLKGVSFGQNFEGTDEEFQALQNGESPTLSTLRKSRKKKNQG